MGGSIYGGSENRYQNVNKVVMDAFSRARKGVMERLKRLERRYGTIPVKALWNA